MASIRGTAARIVARAAKGRCSHQARQLATAVVAIVRSVIVRVFGFAAFLVRALFALLAMTTGRVRTHAVPVVVSRIVVAVDGRVCAVAIGVLARFELCNGNAFVPWRVDQVTGFGPGARTAAATATAAA